MLSKRIVEKDGKFMPRITLKWGEKWRYFLLGRFDKKRDALLVLNAAYKEARGDFEFWWSKELPVIRKLLRQNNVERIFYSIDIDGTLDDTDMITADSLYCALRKAKRNGKPDAEPVKIERWVVVHGRCCNTGNVYTGGKIS